jgi:mitochondrial fission protein ELM1
VLDDIPTLVISVAKTGHLNQCIAFCERMGWRVTETKLIPGPARMNSRLRNYTLRARRWLALRQLMFRRRRDACLRIVASGISAEYMVASYRTLYGSDLYAVYLGSPRWPEQIFDFAIASHHAVPLGTMRTSTCYSGAKAVAWMPGVLARPPRLDPREGEQQKTTVLIGGINKAFRLSADAIVPQLRPLIACHPTDGHTLCVVFSRRTPRRLEAEIRSALASEKVDFVDRHDRQGFLEAFASAKRLAVTPDSITMICEAYSSGKPVLVLDLPAFDQDTSTFRFISEIRTFPSDCAARIIREAADAAIREAAADYEEWCQQRHLPQARHVSGRVLVG